MPKEPFEHLTKRQKQSIIRACTELMAQNGYANTSMKMITKRLKVADGYLYYYFNGKEDLTKWVLEEGIRTWQDHFEEHVTKHSPDTLFELFKLSVFQMARFIHEHKNLFGGYSQLVNEPNFPLQEWMFGRAKWIDDVYSGAIAREIESGRIRSDVPLDLITMLLDVVNTRIQEYLYNPAIDPIGVSRMDDQALDRLLEQLVSILENGIKPV